MLRSRLKNIANASDNQSDWIKYKKQRNKVVALNRKIKAEFFQNAQVISKNHKNFWKACKPLLSSKSNDGNDRIILVENDEIVNSDINIAMIFNSHFNQITKSLNLPTYEGLETFSLLDPVKKAIQTYSNHPSIIKIKGSMSDGVERFNFKNVELNDVQELINKYLKEFCTTNSTHFSKINFLNSFVDFGETIALNTLFLDSSRIGNSALIIQVW